MIAAMTQMQLMIYGALLVSQLVYGYLAFKVFAVQPGRGSMPDALPYVLIAVAASELLIAIPVLRKRLMPARRDAKAIDEPIPDSPAVGGVLGRLFVAQIVTWGMCESIAILGLVLVITSHDPRYYLGFAGASVVGFVVYRPSGELVRAVARAAC
jgi:hypothetical protein